MGRRKRQYIEDKDGQLKFAVGDAEHGPVVHVLMYDVQNYYEAFIRFIDVSGDIAKLRGLKTGLEHQAEREGQKVPESVLRADFRRYDVFLKKFGGDMEKLNERITALTREASDYLVSVENWARRANCGFTHNHGRQMFYGLVESMDRRHYFRRHIRADLTRLERGEPPVLYQIYSLESNYQELLKKREEDRVRKKAQQ